MAKHGLLSLLFAIVAIIESLLFAETLGGWSSYVYVLIDQGFYASLCIEESSNVSRTSSGSSHSSINVSSVSIGRATIQTKTQSCTKQQETLNLFYTISTASMEILTLCWGYLTFKYGIIRPKILSMVLFIGGILMLGFSSPGNAPIIIPGLICTGVGGLAILVFNMKVVAYIDCSNGVYIALLSGAADSSVVTFRLVKFLYDTDVPYVYPFIGISVLHLFICSLSTVLHKLSEKWPTKFQLPPEDNDKRPTHADVENSPTLSESICSHVTIIHIMWYSILFTTYLMYLGTINNRLQNHFPGEVGYFTNIMAYIMFGGLVSSFLPGSVLRWQAKLFKDSSRQTQNQLLQQVVSLSVTSALALILNALSFTTSDATMYIEFIVLTIFRSFLFSCNINFIVSIYPMKHATVIYPISESCAGVVSTIQYGLFRWYNLYPGAQTHVRICLTTLAVVSLLNPLNVCLTAKGVLKTNQSRRCRSKQYIAKMTEITKF